MNIFCDFYNNFCHQNRNLYHYKTEFLKETTDINEIIDILEKYNIYLHNQLFHKQLYIEKINGKLKFYGIKSFANQYIGHILWINILNDRGLINDFEPIILNVKFRNLIKGVSNEDTKYIRKGNSKALGMCYNSLYLEKAFIPYYLTSPSFANKNFNLNLCDTINMLINADKPIKYNKLLFRGSNNNNYRKYLYKHYKNSHFCDFKTTCNNDISIPQNYIDFENYSDYKYILDIPGIDGHCARRFYLFLMNRVLFIPTDDPNKLFFEVWDDPPIPNIHYIPYSMKNLDDFDRKVEILEKNDDIYKRIQKNCYNYAKTHLTFDKIEKYMINIINN